MAETKKVIIDVEVKTQGANVGLDGVKKGVDDTTERVKKLKTETDKTSKSMSKALRRGQMQRLLFLGQLVRRLLQ
jgi:hypothetical protein